MGVIWIEFHQMAFVATVESVVGLEGLGDLVETIEGARPFDLAEIDA